MNRTDQIIESLHQQIAKLTGRVPVSRDQRYLERRLADLRARKAEGEDVRHTLHPSAHMSVSMPDDARAAIVELAQRERLGASALVRDGLVLLARKRGHADLADRIAGEG